MDKFFFSTNMAITSRAVHSFRYSISLILVPVLKLPFPFRGIISCQIPSIPFAVVSHSIHHIGESHCVSHIILFF